MPRLAEDLFVVGLLACLFGVLALGALFVLGIRRRRHRCGIPAATPLCADETAAPTCPLRALVFAGLTCRWLAIRSGTADAAEAALREMGSSDLAGFVESGPRPRQYSDPWRVLVGPSLPDPAEDIDRCYRFLRDLSRRVGWVQFFSLNRIRGDHAWVVAHGGRIIRAYAWVAGEVVWNQGIQTVAERELGVTCLNYCEACTGAGKSATPDPNDNVEKVFLLAAAWGVNPLADTY